MDGGPATGLFLGLVTDRLEAQRLEADGRGEAAEAAARDGVDQVTRRQPLQAGPRAACRGLRRRGVPAYGVLTRRGKALYRP